ncbi:unnamed protein product [Rotaria socialis]|uniref:non-specific serine/threonine protein kinase n=1 Tax=Rotaria socialis TaxID=392032 RepID=A0A818GNF2_9BILA|nr:unnamed protein product [Rotaria socialis]CAF3492985.1 unnamed protein product [Rotaria socialis]CAF4138219.1 unnamed protein product [Rotaria socialis]CAF4233955.1 unnamed protein product [Rotaria socialis]
MLSKKNALDSPAPDNDIDVNEKYTFLKKIGKGSYGEVWLVLPNSPLSIRSQSKQLVLKRLDLRPSANSPSQNDIESAEREAKLLSTLKHPNIVAYIESFCSNDGCLNIVMAYCEGGDLYTKLKEKKAKKESLAEDQLIEWFIQICMALQYIHEKNILHRDLKTQNIFLTKHDIVKVGDLGIARALESASEFATTIVGTPYYMSPEIFSQKPYGQKSDIWALGCCVYEMTTLEHAFNAKDINALVIKILREQTPQMSKKYSEPLIDIIKSMLKKNPDDRPTAKQILQNSYIKQHILRLLEKTKIKCPNPVNAKTRSKLSSSPVSSPSRPNSSAKTSPSRILFSNDSNPTPILPSHPPLPPSYSRPTSGVDANRSSPVADFLPPSEPSANDSRARRRQSRRTNQLLPANGQDKDLRLISKINPNYTLDRAKRDHKLKEHVKQNQQLSSDDDHDPSLVRQYNNDITQSTRSVESPQREMRPSSVELRKNSSRPSSSQPQPRITKSYDLNQGSVSTARQRRREFKTQSSSSEYSISFDSPSQTPTITLTNELSTPTLLNNFFDENEQKQEGENDINDFVLMLTSTLQLPTVNARRSDQLAFSGNDKDRTMSGRLNETSRIQQRYQQIRQQCLREISPNRFRRVFKIIENVSEPQMIPEMIAELGQDVYNRYSGLIFSLKFYEDNSLADQ